MIGAKGVKRSKALLSYMFYAFLGCTFTEVMIDPETYILNSRQSHYNKSSVEFPNEADDTDAEECTLRGK